MKKFLLCLFILTLFSPNSFARSIQETLNQFIEHHKNKTLQSEDAKKLVTKNAYYNWKTPSLPYPLSPNFRIKTFGKYDSEAVVQIMSSIEGIPTPIYLYLDNSEGWKIKEAFFLTESLTLKNNLKTLKNLPLTQQTLFMTDSQIKTFFAQHQDKLLKAIDLLPTLSTPLTDTPLELERLEPLSKKLFKALKDVPLVSLHQEFNQNLVFTLGKINTSTLALIYSPKNEPPIILMGAILWVDEIAPHWFIARYF